MCDLDAPATRVPFVRPRRVHGRLGLESDIGEGVVTCARVADNHEPVLGGGRLRGQATQGG
jgi:hypothetical protein